MERLNRRNEHILYLDEAVFTARGYSQLAWSAPGTNILIRDPLQRQPCIAVIAAVCRCHGLYSWDMREYSYNKEAYIEFLRSIKATWESKEPMYVFQDNCSAHSSRLAKEFYRSANIKPIWNIPYMPEYNQAVERVWANVKVIFRSKLLKYMLNAKAKDKPLPVAVRESME